MVEPRAYFIFSREELIHLESKRAEQQLDNSRSRELLISNKKILKSGCVIYTLQNRVRL